MPPFIAAPRHRALWLASGLLAGLALLGCESPPQEAVDKVDAPVTAKEREQRQALQRDAHREALDVALDSSRAALAAADPIGAYQAGHGSAAGPPLSFADRQLLREALELAQRNIGGIEERHLEPAEVVILRVIRFGLTRLYDELERHPPLRLDPNLPLTEIGQALAELRYRLLSQDCDPACLALPQVLADDLPALREQLEAASLPATAHAGAHSRALASEARVLAKQLRAAKPGFTAGVDTPATGIQTLTSGLDALALGLDAHGDWLGALEAALPAAEHHQTWTAKPPPLRAGGVETIERLPPVLGAQALLRWLSVAERIDLDGDRALLELQRHVGRWQAIETHLLGAGADVQAIIAADPPAPVSVERCEALLATITASLAGVEGMDDAPAPALDCERALLLAGSQPRREGELLLEILERAVIEPQRRALRRKELAELSLVRGQWSEEVHVHLRRIMLLSRIEHPQARAQALLDGRRALCLAQAALWIHAELGPASEVATTVGPACAMLGDAAAISAQVLGDPRAAFAGFGLSLIGDEPARMVGFDRFFWAPLGLMQTLATPPGMHPDAFTLPDDPKPGPSPSMQLTMEELNPSAP